MEHDESPGTKVTTTTVHDVSRNAEQQPPIGTIKPADENWNREYQNRNHHTYAQWRPGSLFSVLFGVDVSPALESWDSDIVVRPGLELKDTSSLL